MEQATWSEIDAISRSGNASTFWSVGDTKNINIKKSDIANAQTVAVEIIGFNHDNSSSGLAGITFATKNLLNITSRMNPREDNNYKSSYMNTTVLPYYIYNELDSDLQSVIKTAYKKTTKGHGDNTLEAVSTKLFLLSEFEVFGKNNYSFAGEGSNYPLFKNTNSRIKKLSNGSGNTFEWWLRSPNKVGSVSYCYVSTKGYVSVTNAQADYGDYGICFGFCV